MNSTETIAFQIILHGGNARSDAMEAMQMAKSGDSTEAREKLLQAGEELKKAHKFQTELIGAEARGERSELSILLIHAQDHLMNAMTVKDLAEEIISLYEKIK
ncbi:PTS lactose/cellobiose transporter subunit IIA [Bacillus sp. 165]|uniref:PTS lactose/cellobiose transporter subunit IIA n=1 Tax=Bacillus sp. 165 TaxID=1529117 RepID=UPI001AD96504|nr:PTS lactose/cellobiose transporter subunit IIA [Bacillus sp. 165]